MSLLASFALSKNKNSEASRLIVRPPPPPFPVLYLSKCLMYFLFIYTISISIICVSQEELNLIASNEQIYDFYNRAFLKRHFIQCNADSCCEYMTDDVNTYLYGCVSLLVPECVGYLSVYVCKTHTKVVLVLRYQGIHNIIKRNNTSNVARSPI